MKRPRHSLVVVCLVAAGFLGACAKARIEGVVQSPDGEGLPDVEVAIENSGLRTNSDQDGNYSLEYFPGTFTVVYRKPSFTTSLLSLTLAEKTRFPAEGQILWPFPDSTGLYHVRGDALTEIAASPMQWSDTIINGEVHRRFLAEGATPESLPSGDLAFVDRTDLTLQLMQLTDDDLIYDAIFRGSFDPVYEVIVDSSSEQVGKEQLLIRRAALAPGRYAWIDIRGSERSALRFRDICFVFDVGA